MHKEFDYHTKRSIRIFKKKLFLPRSSNILPFTRDFKRKREPYGSIRKWKARFFKRGYVQKIMSIDLNNSNAPVVNLSIVRMMSIMTYIFDLMGHAIDFSECIFPGSKEWTISIHVISPMGWN